ncbi:MAG: hypothetical protein U0931_42440 [Vulcanimicrobiota bacterium]
MRRAWRTYLTVSLACVVSFGLGIALPAGLRRSLPRPVRTVAQVNGETLSEDDLRIAMTAYRRVAIEDLVSQRLVQQEAKRRGLPLEVSPFEPPVAGLLPDELQAVSLQNRSDVLRKRLVLADYTPAEKRRIFDSLAPDLYQYSLFAIVLQSAEDYPILLRDLERGASFESLVPKYSVSVPMPEPGRLTLANRGTVSKYLGPYVGDALLGLKSGDTSPLLPSPFGQAVIKVIDKRTDYRELEPELDNLLFQSESLALDYRLGKEAFVSSDLAPELSKQRNKPRGTPLAVSELRPISAQSVGNSLPRNPMVPLKEVRGPNLLSPPKKAAPKPKPLPLPIPHAGEAPSLPGLFRATLERRRHRLLAEKTGNHQVVRLDRNDNLHADPEEPILVHVTVKGWQPVERLNEPVNRFAMENDYGWWTHPNSSGSVTTQVNANDVKLNILHPIQGDDHLYELGVEVWLDEQGHVFQLEQTARYSANLPISAADLGRMDDYRETSANWTVTSP